MAIPLITSLTSIVVWLFGGHAALYCLGGIIVLIGVILGWRSPLGLWIVATASYLSAAECGSAWPSLLWVMALLSLNASAPSPTRGSTALAASAVIAANLIGLFMVGRQDLAHLLVPLFCAVLPLRCPQLPHRAAAISEIFLYVLCGFLLVTGFQSLPREEKNLFITHGNWANARLPYSLDGLNIESAYSYSELPRFLGATQQGIKDSFQGFTQAWVITPTAPIEESVANRIADWVKAGGHLIVVTDHTDLYGHGRVSNGLIKPYGIRGLYNTTTNEHGIDSGQDAAGRGMRLKSANSFILSSGVPIATKRGWTEKAYYGRDNFFGPLVPSLDDTHGRHILGGCTAYGKGRVTVFGDSTMLANFALYQPDSMRMMSSIQRRYYLAEVARWLPWAVILAAFVFTKGRRSGAIAAFGAILVLGVTDFWPAKERWKIPSVAWSGDTALVMENGNPKMGISTAYSVSVMSGFAPRWVSNTEGEPSGIWVSQNRPAPKGWRWVKPDTVEETAVLPSIATWSELFDRLGAEQPRDWMPMFQNKDDSSVGGVWTDDVMGDWWFDRGISESRRLRFQAWLNWVAQKPPTPPLKPNSELWSDASTEKWELRFAGNNQILELSGPAPLFTPSEGAEILLGRGVSVQSVLQNGRLILLGQKTKCEGIGIPPLWVLLQKQENTSPTVK